MVTNFNFTKLHDAMTFLRTLVIAQLVQNFPCFHGTVSARAYRWTET
jgi:hypothetical protein